MNIQPTVFLKTYGCQMNLYDGELVAGLLEREGFAMTSHLEEAEVILVNTCGVRDHAERRVLGRLRSFSSIKRRRPELLIGVLGCMAQRMGEELKRQVPSVDFVIGPDAYRLLPGLLKNRQNGTQADQVWLQEYSDETYGDVSPRRREGVNAFVAIMRGCDNFCSYCIVPYVRGRERSRSAEEIAGEVQKAVEGGYPEVTLLGQNVNSYRWQTDSQQVDFPTLLDRVSRIPGLARLRFMTSHPRDISDRLVERLAEDGTVCPSLHLPVQSGSDRILELMGRGYTRSQYLEKVRKLRDRVPDLALTTDLLCGFPTESEEDFRQTLDLMTEVRFDDAFTFKYSPRPGTAAASMNDDVSEEEKVERLEKMISLARLIADQSRRKMIGREVEVLLENPSPRDESEWTGRTRCGRVALVPGDFKRADVVEIRIEKVWGFSLWGKPGQLD